jgi:hypothetical protein
VLSGCTEATGEAFLVSPRSFIELPVPTCQLIKYDGPGNLATPDSFCKSNRYAQSGGVILYQYDAAFHLTDRNCSRNALRVQSSTRPIAPAEYGSLNSGNLHPSVNDICTLTPEGGSSLHTDLTGDRYETNIQIPYVLCCK